MPLTTISGEANSQDLNDNFSYLESAINEANEMGYINAADLGVVTDKTTDNTIIIQNILDSITPPTTVMIPVGTKWDYTQITHPLNIVIWDISTYDWKYDDWTAQQKYLLNTDNPSLKNANEFIVTGPWHPAFVVDNVGAAGDPMRASTIYRYNGESIWRTGMGIYDNDKDFCITEFPNATTRMGIRQITGEMSFNSVPVNGISYFFKNPLDDDMSIRYATKTLGQNIIFAFSEPSNGFICKIKINSGTGTLEYMDGSDVTGFYAETDGTIYGNKNKIEPKTTTYTIVKKDSKKVLTNEGSPGGFIMTLPPATKGLEYSFCNVVEGNNLQIEPNGADSFRGLASAKYKKTAIAGSYLNIKCCINGVWEVISEVGTWTNEV